MLFTIDIENPNLTLGWYQDGEPGFRWRQVTDHADRMVDEYRLRILGLLQHAGCTPLISMVFAWLPLC